MVILVSRMSGIAAVFTPQFIDHFQAISMVCVYGACVSVVYEMHDLRMRLLAFLERC